MKQFISWAIIKRLTESESILLKRGIEAHFRARLQPYSGPVADPSRDYAKTAIPTGLPGPGVHVLDRLLTATEKLVHLGRLHVRPIQWHLKNNWRVPESLER